MHRSCHALSRLRADAQDEASFAAQLLSETIGRLLAVEDSVKDLEWRFGRAVARRVENQSRPRLL